MIVNADVHAMTGAELIVLRKSRSTSAADSMKQLNANKLSAG